MSLTFDLETIHNRNLEDLSEKFQYREVKDIYNRERKELEKEATVKEFIPILLYNKIIQQMKGV